MTFDDTETVNRWRRGLSELIGCSPREVAERVDLLYQFCAERGVSPASMIDECRHGPVQTARRAFYLNGARDALASIVVQSFLVHNGINVFGELICMPKTVASVAREQGTQWRLRSS